MSAAGSEDDYEHWPSEKKFWTEPPVPAPGYDSNNGLQYHSYFPAKSPSPEKAPAPQVPPIVFQATPAGGPPLYWPHQQAGNSQPQYCSHPPQAVYYHPNPTAQGYYTYGAPPAAAPTPAPAPAPAPMAPAAPAELTKFHTYVPATADAKSEAGGSHGNRWIGRTKAEVEEDNMKIAKREGATEKRKIAPVGVEDDQLFWVVELDDSHTLRDYRYIKTITGTWKKDPRFEDTYYFLREEEEKKK